MKNQEINQKQKTATDENENQLETEENQLMKTKINWKQKLTSRKLWAALVGIVAGLASVFGITENDYAQVAGLVTMAASVVAYIFGEAKVDAARQYYQPEKQPEEQQPEKEEAEDETKEG